MDKCTQVACAIVLKDNRVFVAQRSERMNLPLKWEFPGGKVEKNESPEACLKREIKEELNLDIEVLQAFPSNFHSYSAGKEIELMPFLCRILGGDLILKEHKNCEWKEVGELHLLDWAEADKPILRAFVAWFGLRNHN